MATVVNYPIPAHGKVSYPRLRIILESLNFNIDDQLSAYYKDDSVIRANKGTINAPGLSFSEGITLSGEGTEGLYWYSNGGHGTVGMTIEGNQVIQSVYTGGTLFGSWALRPEPNLATAAEFSLYAPTTNKGSIRLLPADNAGSTVTTITNASQAAARIYTIPDAGTDTSFVMAAGTQTIAGSKTFSSAIAVTPTSNQLVLGATRTVTFTAPTPATASRTITFPDLSGDYSVVGTIGTQSIDGSKTFTAALVVTGANIQNIFGTAGSTVTVTAQHTDNTNSASHATFTVETGGASGGDPWVRFYNNVANYSLGIDNSDSDALCLTGASTLNGTNILRIDSSTATWGRDILTSRSNVGGNVFVEAENTDNTNGASNAYVHIRNGGSSGGDPYLFLNVAGVTSWSMGIDNSLANDPLTIARQQGLGANEVLNLYATAVLPGASSGSSGVLNLGDGGNYWADVSYKTLTDRGCLPYCDDGVELRDGTIVSDLAALCATRVHPTHKTGTGLPRLDYTTFPKHAYKSVEDEVLTSERFKGSIVERDELGEATIITPQGKRIPAQDGIEMTMLFGVMIGAFKELNTTIKTLQDRIAVLEAK